MKRQAKKLNWGLVSTARINQALIPALRQSSRNHLLAVASRAPAKAEAYAAEHHISRAYGSYEAMLADPEIEAVYISLPNHLHAEWAVRAAQAGKHVLCEKPLALTVAEVDAIQVAAQKAGVVAAEAFMYRHHPQTLKIQEWIAEGAIGKVRYVRGSFSFMIQPDNIRINPEWGGGCLWDVGCYPVSYAMMIAGEPPVEVSGWQETGDSQVDMLFTGQLRFHNGILAQFDSAFNLPLFTGMEIRGTEGSLVVPAPFKPDPRQKVLLNRGGRVEKLSFPSRSPYLCEVEDFAEAALDGRPPRITLEQSRDHIATLQALLQSARENRPVII